MQLGSWIFSRLRRLLNVFRTWENAPNELASDALPEPSTFSPLCSVPGPHGMSDVEEEARQGLLYEGVVYEVEPTRVYVYVSELDERAVAFTTKAFQTPMGTLLKFRLKHSTHYAIADLVEKIGVIDHERLLDVYRKVYPRQEFREKQRAEASLDADNEQQADAPKPAFAAPENWNFTATEKKATDLLGVAVATAKGTTTFYKRLGTVEIPAEAQLGVWVRMDVTLTEGRFAPGEDDVLRIEQLVPPPMDTRVIRGKRVMLTAVIEKHPEGVGNEYLGAVLDPLSLVPRDRRVGVYVAELEYEKGCFYVVKCHRPATSGVPATVPQKESAYPFPVDQRGMEVQDGIEEYGELLQLQNDA